MTTKDLEFNAWDHKKSFQNLFLLNLLTELEKREVNMKK